MMPEQRITLSGAEIGSMVDSIDPAILPVGVPRLLRNLEFVRGKPRRRRGWARMFNRRLPFTTCINGKNGVYRDTGGRLHRLYVGDNGRLYHALGETPTAWTEVTVHLDVPWTWDGTYRCAFGASLDDMFITFWQPPESATIPPAGAQNLRFAGLSDTTDPAGVFHAFGVSIAAPATAPVAAVQAGGDIPFGTYNYFVTFRDALSGQESDRSPIVTIDLVQPSEPTGTPAAVAGAPGAVPAGINEWCFCFVDTVTGARSERSPMAALNCDGLTSVDLTNIQICPDLVGGPFQREIYRRTGGGPLYRLAIIADNVTLVYNDNLAAPPAPLTEYDEGRLAVNLTAIPVYAGGGTPANGRDIERCIYRQDNGEGSYHRLTAGFSELADNVTAAYLDAVEAPLGDAWSRSVAVPPCGIVCPGPDNTLIWCNDRENQLPAQVYAGASDERPESIAVDEKTQAEIISYRAGTHDDPITSADDTRDGWVIGKRRAIHYMGRECGMCERILKLRGNVGPGTGQVVDTRYAFLTPEGPGFLNHHLPGDFRFCGSDAARFCLAGTWERVVRSRLPYATSFHWPAASLVGWAVQLCDDWPVAPHNDTAILWDYSIGEGGRVWIVDWPGCDCFMGVPAAGSSTDTVEAVFAYGIAARLFDGEHNDGTVGVLSGTVIAVDGTLVDVDVAALQGQNVVGSILWINGGTGTRVCRPVDACENARALIVSQCGGRLRLAGELGITAGSLFEIGGFQDAGWFPINAGNPQATKKYLTIHVRTD